MNKIRDYSGKTIRAFIKYMDEYYNAQNDKIKGFWNKFGHWLSSFSKNKDKNGDPERYIRSLAERRSDAERKIKDVWLKVGTVEEEYLSIYNKIEDSCEAYSDILSRLTSSINITTFSKRAPFGDLLNRCADSYFMLMETKVEQITQKPVDQLTDGDIEILSYVALTTTDQELKEKIYNTFYREASDKHISYPNGTPDDPYFHYYERDDDAWEKFLQCEEAYFQSLYSKYLNGELSEEEINNCIRNHLTVQFLNKNGDLLFTGKDGRPITISDKGEVSVSIPRKSHISVFNSDNKVDRDSYFWEQEYENELSLIPINKKTFDSDVSIDNGADAEAAINSEISDKLQIDRQLDWSDAGDKLFKVGTKIIDHFVPGTGKILSELKKYTVDIPKKASDKAETVNDIVDESSPEYVTDSQKEGYAEFMKMFDIKCVRSGGGFILYPSRNTKRLIDRMLEWMKENHNDIYQELVSQTASGMTDAEWFLNNVEPDQFYNNLQASGLLKEMQDAGII